ncbi:hypothetical protein EV182_002379, partial [Spiromyces aspiralis]
MQLARPHPAHYIKNIAAAAIPTVLVRRQADSSSPTTMVVGTSDKASVARTSESPTTLTTLLSAQEELTSSEGQSLDFTIGVTVGKVLYIVFISLAL